MGGEDWQSKLDASFQRFEIKFDNGFKRLEDKIDSIEKDHGITRERQIEASRDVYHLTNDLREFKNKYDDDKDKIYTIMKDEIKKGVKESISGAKIFVYSLLGVILTVLIGLINKVK